ncbi:MULTISPECIES: lipid-A-disaccharide synthase-related protein [Prochlorococcus]|uniref:Uncharacterized conserved protein n=1 Tax=Prochlorococcus marinus (strain SARG / CCMP1375 / SS120) TaxID=167539 RepID=Q7VE74_PROMA|nr:MULTISPECIES: lipid-A-disaccharide synthase-related protein [Prochlorococcus]AAP99185.1 Uncharacterized conserved protein [Prochlorococcus marinus subsp. marinus str. CCMP1375]KGG11546.1 hypothetical protein EV04_1072 [Prochlorococcus marinus str. LG]KGG18500.1 hypothetical protein EV08_1746 [Prochlorococcus marinus str. SS2]KGG22773.1 hypothetical protein EV09_1513 [Prochlorococcus marinus str. SS35]KGG32650.1 hypothetical protein EV10_0966 [Prochlorococcus marinus str. SS51]
MARLLLISNGHGEDFSGALLAVELKQLGHNVDAFPLVGKGNAYKKAGIKIDVRRKEFSTGGLGYTSFLGRITELLQGQHFYLLWSFIRLLVSSSKYDLLIVVGDVLPVLAAWMSCKDFVVYLVAYSSHYEGVLKLPWPAANCLRSRRCLELYTRDNLTAEDLGEQLNRSVVFFGNPFMDPVLTPKKQFPEKIFRLGVLPGSRRPELDNNLLMVLRVLKCLPKPIFANTTFSFDMALVDALSTSDLNELIASNGWHIIEHSLQSNSFTLSSGFCWLKVHRESFVELLQSSDAFLCMAGTATEQAIGLAKPVIQLPGKGPQFTSSFAEAQRRLLGPTVFCAETNITEGNNIFFDTSHLILEVCNRMTKANKLQSLCYQQAGLRLGTKGGTKRIAQSINHLIL